MEYLGTITNKMIRPFYYKRNLYNRETLECITFDDNNIFNKSLVVDIVGDDIEIPSIIRTYYEPLINSASTYNTFNDIKTKRVVLPLYTNCIPKCKRTFNGIIGEFFCNVTHNQRLLKIITGKGEVYYGGFGLILDEEFNPLLMCGLKARKIVTKNNEGIETTSMQYYRAFCRISPIVFTDPTKLINKGIIKKLIPLYTSINILFPSDSCGISNNPESNKVEIIVDDFSKLFITPIAPTPSKCINDVLNKCLNDNIEDILRMI